MCFWSINGCSVTGDAKFLLAKSYHAARSQRQQGLASFEFVNFKFCASTVVIFSFFLS